MADEPISSWRERAAATQPRGELLDPDLDPVEGVRAFPTVYVPGRLLITGDPAAALTELSEAAKSFGWLIEPDTVLENRNPEPTFRGDDRRPVQQGEPVGVRIPRNTQLTRAWIMPLPVTDRTAPVPPVDAWRLLQAARLRRAPAGRRDPVRRTDLADRLVLAPDDPLRAVGLDHVLSVDTIGMNRFARTNPEVTRFARTNPAAGTDSYASPGTGGLEVVTFTGPAPEPRYTPKGTGRRPVVAVVDTGCGAHDWLPERGAPTLAAGAPSVWRRVPAPQPPAVIGIDEERTDPEVFGDQTGPRDGLIDAASGHGTFVSGMVRQSGPDADLIVVRVADSDGSVIESELIQALEELVAEMDRPDDKLVIDVLNLSMGYYPETPEDGLFSTRLYDLLADVRSHGVVVVCSAGNDATDRPAFPAALWPWGDPLLGIVEDGTLAAHVSVGALNPDRRTVALYSNIGPWVRVFAPGTSVLSTTPAFEGGVQAGTRDDLYGLIRTTIDPDDFTGGFAIWSGTSFAAPHVSGLIAQAMAEQLTATGERPAGAVQTVVAALDAWVERMGARLPHVEDEPPVASVADAPRIAVRRPDLHGLTIKDS